jgi:hopanoid biosynthesis associated protein HpnK
MSAHPLLIVNADDFGIAEAVNDGIVAAHDRGIVTSASVMATGPAFEHAVALARSRPRLAVGVHLVLTEHAPLAGSSVPSLTDANGRFPRHATALARRQLRRRAVAADVRRELDAQIRRVREAGLAITHLDGHQHVHVLPGIAQIVAELAAQHRIAAVRYPVERVRGYMLRSAKNLKRLAEQVALRLICARSPLAPLRRSDDFVGFYFGGRLDERNLTTVLETLPRDGTVELMCHPGDERMHAADWSYGWAAERDALTSPRIRALLAARGVQLIANSGV